MPYDGPPGEKRCTQCGVLKPLSEFGKHGGRSNLKDGGRQPACKACRYEFTKAWCEANPKAVARKNLRQRAHYLGLNRDEVSDYFDSHDGRCDICGGPPSHGHLRLDIEHDHGTNEFRGATCSDCNQVIGHAHDSVEILQKVIAYLINPPARPNASRLF